MSDGLRFVPVRELLTDTIGGVWGDAPGESDVTVRVLRSTEFRNDGSLAPASAARRSVTERQLARRQLRPDDILLEKSGGGPQQPVGRVCLVDAVDGPAVCSNFVQLVRPDPLRVEPRFLFYMMWFWHQQGTTLEYQAATTGIRNLRTKDYLARPVRVPPRHVQQRVVELVEAFNRAISAHHRHIEQARALTKAFGTRAWRESRHLALSEIGEGVTGSTPPTKVEEFWNTPDVPFITPGDFTGGLFVDATARAISAEGAKRSRLLSPPSVAQVCIGATLGKVAAIMMATRRTNR
jgi:hypothetical protein